MSVAKKKVSVAWLAERGVHGMLHAEEFYDSKIVRDVDYWTHDGKAVLILEDEGRFWRLEIEHHPEDWSGTNDLHEWRDQPEHQFEITEVEEKLVATWADKETT